MQHFFIIGAQKSGTTSLAAALARHPDICFSRPKEPMYFSYDEPAVHPHFFLQKRAEWQALVWHQGGDVLGQYLGKHFGHYQGETWLGEASTSYLPSSLAPARIATYCPQAKIVILLRDPVQRAYSAYWHYVRTGRSVETFERHLQYENGLTLLMGEYARHIQHWLGYFPKESLLVIRFEDLVVQQETTMREVCRFLDIDYHHGLLGVGKDNASVYPKSLTLKLWCNRCRRSSKLVAVLGRVLDALDRMNIQDKHALPMDKHLGLYLDAYYKKANAGLDGLLKQMGQG